MGLRQLYFLLDGLLDRLIYLSYGLATILAFIGVKLVLHALHENTLPFINGGEHVPVFEITTGLSLSVIIGVLFVTIVASLVSKSGKAQTVFNNARRHATSYLELEYTADPQERERVYNQLMEEEKAIAVMEPKFRDKHPESEEILVQIEQAHQAHRDHLNA